MRKIPAGLYSFQVGIYASSVDAYKNGGVTAPRPIGRGFPLHRLQPS